MNWIASLFSPDTRKWIYDVAMAVIPLFVIIGVINTEVAGQVMLIAAAVLGTGTNLLARANVAPAKEEYKG